VSSILINIFIHLVYTQLAMRSCRLNRP